MTDLPSNAFLRAITYCAYILALVIWAILGLLFWIPFLTRSIATFSGMILYAALTSVDSRSFGYHLERAIGFYPDGFRRIKESLFHGSNSLDPIPPIKLDRFLLEILWTVIFWALIFYWIVPLDFLKFLH